MLQPNYVALRPTDATPDEQQSHSQRIIKIAELKALLYKHRLRLNQDPETILRSILAYSSSRGDDSILDEWLEQLRAIDRTY